MAPFYLFIHLFTLYNYSLRLQRWLKGSNVNLDVIMHCLGMWVNRRGLVCRSLRWEPGMRSPAPWIFSSLSPRTILTTSLKDTTLKKKRLFFFFFSFQLRNNKRKDTLTYLSYLHPQNSFVQIYGSPWQQVAICGWCLNLSLAVTSKYTDAYTTATGLHQQDMLSSW